MSKLFKTGLNSCHQIHAAWEEIEGGGRQQLLTFMHIMKNEIKVRCCIKEMINVYSKYLRQTNSLSVKQKEQQLDIKNKSGISILFQHQPHHILTNSPYSILPNHNNTRTVETEKYGDKPKITF